MFFTPIAIELNFCSERRTRRPRHKILSRGRLAPRVYSLPFRKLFHGHIFGFSKEDLQVAWLYASLAKLPAILSVSRFVADIHLQKLYQ
jgi:hypothetical protein